jgi:hypothetical protein
VELYVVSTVLVFVFSGLFSMAGLGAAFLFVPLFYYLGIPLSEVTSTALLLNVVSLLFATVNYWRGRLVNSRLAIHEEQAVEQPTQESHWRAVVGDCRQDDLRSAQVIPVENGLRGKV